MSLFSRLFAFLNILFLALFAAQIARAEPHNRVVSIGGSVTEIVYALGQDKRLVARDTTSSYPAEVTALPNVGYARALSPEGVLSIAPDLILATEGAGPPETLEVLKAANVTFIEVPEVFSAKGVAQKIETVGAALGQEAEARALADQVTAELEAALSRAKAAAGDRPKKVLFILSTQGGRIMAGGQETAADGIIRMAGGVNAVQAFSGYKQITDEAVSAAAPDVILAMDRSGDHGMSAEKMLSIPALIPTPAAQVGALVRMNGLHLLGFGPRTASAVTELSNALYGAPE